ncbi:hypothetical protein PYCCODRAFT_516113 [Trametes coccinea BRFM310]|uniref:Cytochrome P450 n=1 Tax=Trametes coccinea (strain BRFM310) TaxID=1353009 RepID=A0A1Y2IJZ5_TRAC3|nr:hypothetical protein PYCCODRAFT_516113 [Trametes coccinea BRFM310]
MSSSSWSLDTRSVFRPPRDPDYNVHGTNTSMQTSAHTLAYAFILLALYPDEQEKLYQAIKKTLHDGHTPGYEEFSSFAYSMAFSETESIAVLTLVISRYRVEVKDEPQFAGETFAQRKARLLKSKLSVTLFPERAPLVFKRRSD